MLILRNKSFHEFVLTVLPRPLSNTFLDWPYPAFISKLFIYNDSLILRSCMLDNFASVFGCSQLNCPWQTLECSVALDASHFLAMLCSWCSIDGVSTQVFVSPAPMYIFFSFAADVKIALHPVFQMSFLILGPIIDSHGSLAILLSAFSVLGA